MRVSASLLLATLIASGSASAADRKATAYQVTPAHNARVTFSHGWGPKLSVVWTATLDGPAGTPVVVGSRIYAPVAGSPDEIVEIDAKTGKTVWKSSAGSAASVGLAFDEGRVFSATNAGLITAYDAHSGKLAWSVQLQNEYSTIGAPSALSGLLYVSAGSFSGPKIFAFDEASGSIVWSNQVGGYFGTSPSVTPTGVYVNTGCSYYDFAPATGAQIWSSTSNCYPNNAGAAVTADNLVFVQDPSNAILDAQTGAVIGSFPGNNPPVMKGDVGYFLDNTTLSAINPMTSRLFWEFAGDKSVLTPPLVVNDYVVVASQQGNLYVVDAAKGTAAETIGLGGAPAAPLGAGDNLILVPLGNTLVAYGSTN